MLHVRAPFNPTHPLHKPEFSRKYTYRMSFILCTIMRQPYFFSDDVVGKQFCLIFGQALCRYQIII